jgi:formylmethanofuran dehydrogenase subunit E
MSNSNIIENVNNERLEDQLRKVEKFHGCLSPGAMVGIFMMNHACKILGCGFGDDIFVTVETHNCLPDAATALTNCTIGNKRLRIVDYGKMALTLTKRDDFDGIRIILDPNKTMKYPTINAWYLNERDALHREVVKEILEAGEDILSFEYVRIGIPSKGKKEVVLCPECGEPFVSRKGEEKCEYCAGERYYEVI